MENKPVVDDYSVRLNADFEGEKYEFLLCAVYDRIDHFPRYGAWILKLIDPQHGFVKMVITGEQAEKIQEQAGLPIVERDPMFQSELDLYRKAQENSLEDWMNED